MIIIHGIKSLKLIISCKEKNVTEILFCSEQFFHFAFLAVNLRIMSMLFLFVAFISHPSLSQYLPYFWNETYTMDGIYDITSQTRTYHIAYWETFQSNDPTYQYPVIYALHGGGGQAAGHARQTGLHIEANELGYLVIYPEGMAFGSNTSRTWNAGICCGAAAAYNSNDVKFLLDILYDVETTRNILNIDRNRIFFTGHSNVCISYKTGNVYFILIMPIICLL